MPEEYTVDQFADIIRKKFPGAYDKRGNKELVDAWVEKYPVYADRISGLEKPKTETSGIETPETITQRVRRLAGEAWQKVRPENPVRTGFGMVGAGIGSLAALPSWATGPLAIPAEFAAGGAGYTGGTHVYDLLTRTMPYGATTSGEYFRRTVPSEFVTGGIQESAAPLVNSLIVGKAINPLLEAGAETAGKKVGEMTFNEILSELMKVGGRGGLSAYVLGRVAEAAGLGKETAKLGQEALALLVQHPAVRNAVFELVNRGATNEVVAALEAEMVRQRITPSGPTTTVPPPSSRAQALERWRGVRGGAR